MALSLDCVGELVFVVIGAQGHVFSHLCSTSLVVLVAPVCMIVYAFYRLLLNN
jgi:hypothetical protein